LKGEITMLFHITMKHAAPQNLNYLPERTPGLPASLVKHEKVGRGFKVKAQILLRKTLPSFVLMIVLTGSGRHFTNRDGIIPSPEAVHEQRIRSQLSISAQLVRSG
jgi:hypothetical protein